MREQVEVVIVGGGQAGLCTAAELKRRGVEALILEAGATPGQAWRERWDSLLLFTPARYSSLPGLRFPAPAGSYPTKDQMAEYLETYARERRLAVRTGCRVTSVRRDGSGFEVATPGGVISAASVVIATGLGRQRLPAWAAELDPATRQLTSFDYRNPGQLAGDVLVVGAATSGVEIAIEAAEAGHRTVLAGRETGQVPARAYAFGGRLFWFFATRVASVHTPIGRRIRAQASGRGAPLIRVAMADAVAAGVERAPRATGADGGGVRLADGRVEQPSTVVWCTGYAPDLSWLEVPGVTDEAGAIRHRAGAVVGVPGLYFVGLPFQTRMASAFVGGVKYDAAAVAEEVRRRAAVPAAVSRSPRRAGRRGHPPLPS